jgi:hypothetical protein
MTPTQIAAEDAHEADHRLRWRDHIPGWVKEKLGFIREVQVLKKRISELESKGCLTEDEKKDLEGARQQLQQAEPIATGTMTCRPNITGMITLEGGSKTVSPTKVISLITTAVAALAGTTLLALLLALNSGHSSRVRSAWSEWYLNPTAAHPFPMHQNCAKETGFALTYLLSRWPVDGIGDRLERKFPPAAFPRTWLLYSEVDQ